MKSIKITFCTLLIIGNCVPVFSNQTSEEVLQKVIALEKQVWIVKDLLLHLADTHNITFSYGNLTFEKEVALPEKEMDIQSLLNHVLQDMNISYTVKGSKILFYEINDKNKSYFNQNFKGSVIQNDSFHTPVYGASLHFVDLKEGISTDRNGRFEMEGLPRGIHKVQVSFVGFKTHEYLVSLPTENQILILEEDEKLLQSVEVSDKKIPSILLEQTGLSTIKVGELPLDQIPKFNGEPDLIRMIQNLPGVKTDSDLTGGLNVRGGRNDQNLILMDGVPVYNPWHYFGLFSAFHTEAIKSAEFSKGVFPAKFGSRLSSVLNIKLQDGSARNGGGDLTLSPTSVTLSYGRPINQNTSFMIAARRTYVDPIFWILLSGDHKVRYRFLDLNTKFVHHLRPTWKLEAGVNISNDVFKYREVKNRNSGDKRNIITNLGWINRTGSIKLIQHKNNRNSTSHLFVSHYRSNNEYDKRWNNQEGAALSQSATLPGFSLTRTSLIEILSQNFWDIGAQHDVSHTFTDQLSLSYGVQWINHRFEEKNLNQEIEEGFVSSLFDSVSNTLPLSEVIFRKVISDTLVSQPHELSSYLDFSIKLGNLSFYPGIRFQHYTSGNYSDVLPRLNLKYEFSPNWYASAGYGHFTQYLHTVGLDLIRLPIERWFWSNENRKPLRGKTWTAGVGYSNPLWGEFTVEGYYKSTENLLNFSPRQQEESFAQSFLIPTFPAQTFTGNGESHGVEFLWNKTKGRLQGWIGYTLSWAWNQFDEFNRGLRYPSRTDKRHDIQFYWTYDLKVNWQIGALFNFQSGQPVTFSIAKFAREQDPLGIGSRNSAQETGFVDEINNFRLPAYHRLDLNIAWKNRRLFNRKGEISMDIFNLYNRFNVLNARSRGDIFNLSDSGEFTVSQTNNFISQLPLAISFNLRVALAKHTL